MKKLVVLAVVAVFALAQLSAQQQRFGFFVDTEYILNNIPAYKTAQAQLDRLSADWQKEIEAQYAEVERLYKNYQTERVMLSEDMRKRREDEIVNKDQAVKDLQRKYYGPDGELSKKQQELMQPIQDEVYKVIKEMVVEGRYTAAFDSAADASVLYVNPREDKSDDVLEKLGYKK